MNTLPRAAYRAAPAITLGALLLSTLVALGDPIDRSELYVKDGDTVIVGPGGEPHMKDQEYRLVGFDTPETARGKCPSEIEKGNRGLPWLQQTNVWQR